MVDEHNTILSALHYKIWNDNRKILAGKPYVFPPAQLDPRTLDQDSFAALLEKSEKENIVKSLAMECSLGGIYAEELLVRAGVSKELLPKDVSASDQEKIRISLQNLFDEDLVVWSREGEVFPRQLQTIEGVSKDSTFNEEVASLVLKKLECDEQKESVAQNTKSLSKTQKVIKVQEKQLFNLKKSAQENQEKGELLYTRYQEVQELLSTLAKWKKTCSWDEIKEKAKEFSLIKSIDEHTGTITVELD